MEKVKSIDLKIAVLIIIIALLLGLAIGITVNKKKCTSTDKSTTTTTTKVSDEVEYQLVYNDEAIPNTVYKFYIYKNKVVVTSQLFDSLPDSDNSIHTTTVELGEELTTQLVKYITDNKIPYSVGKDYMNDEKNSEVLKLYMALRDNEIDTIKSIIVKEESAN